MIAFVFIGAEHHAHQFQLLRIIRGKVIKFICMSVKESVNPSAHLTHFVIVFYGFDFHICTSKFHSTCILILVL
nr:MAG TPA: hypothetical protein [Caudoviricetes sp.]